MKQVYILRTNEEDGVLLDALLAEGPANDEDPSNPTCPRCGSDTMLVYLWDDDEYAILTDRVGTEPDDEIETDEWFLTCQNANCTYEEAVERVLNPAGAILFDPEWIFHQLDETYALYSRSLPGMEELVAALQERIKQIRTHNVAALLFEARWQSEAALTDAREWLARLAPNAEIVFDYDDKPTEAQVVAVTEDGALLLTKAGEMLAAPLRVMTRDQVRLKKDKPEPVDLNPDPDRLIDLSGFGQYVVVRGQRLEHKHVDRLGQFHVGCRNAESAAILGLEQVVEGYWEGRFRRSDIEAHYDARVTVQVKGYWLRLNGRTWQRKLPWVTTSNPEIAAALGLAKMPEWHTEGAPTPTVSVPRYSGVITWEQVEEQGEERTYHWPLPTAPEDPSGA
ncbi:MAG TPA: hypothetical protein VGK74_24230 [Symbiobacteriaceae bacterium]